MVSTGDRWRESGGNQQKWLIILCNGLSIFVDDVLGGNFRNVGVEEGKQDIYTHFHSTSNTTSCKKSNIDKLNVNNVTDLWWIGTRKNLIETDCCDFNFIWINSVHLGNVSNVWYKLCPPLPSLPGHCWSPTDLYSDILHRNSIKIWPCWGILCFSLDGLNYNQSHLSELYFCNALKRLKMHSYNDDECLEFGWKITLHHEFSLLDETQYK